MAEVRNRATSADILVARHALSAVSPYNRNIGDWQATAVRLMALGQRPSVRSAEILAEAKALQRKVEDCRSAFDQKSERLPRHIASDSRVADTRRALHCLHENVTRAVQLLANGERETTSA